MKIIFNLLVLTFISIQINAQNSSTAINALIETNITKYSIPSMVIAVVKPDTCYYGKGGVLRINSDEKVNLKSKYHLGSDSKAITSFVAMTLIEDSLLNLKTKLLDLIPELAKNARVEYKYICLADLLSHTAQIQHYTTDEEFEKLPELKGSTSEQRMQFTSFVLTEPPVGKLEYSNAGYVIATLMLERASGKSFEELLKKTLNELNLDYFIGFPDKQNHLYPSGHWVEDSILITLPTTHPYKLMPIMVAAGDIAMDIVDYSKFIQLHLNGANGNCKYLTCKGYNDLLEYKKPYALGWANGMDDNGLKYYGHNGSAGTYYCHNFIFPSNEVAIIIMTNSAEDEHKKGINEIREQILELLHENKLIL